MEVPFAVRPEAGVSLFRLTVGDDTGVQDCEALRLEEAAVRRERVLCDTPSARGTGKTVATVMGSVAGGEKSRRIRWMTKSSFVKRTGGRVGTSLVFREDIRRMRGVIGILEKRREPGGSYKVQ